MGSSMVLVMPVAADLRRDDHRRRIGRDLELRRRLRRPGFVITLRRMRQPAIGRRFDFETTIAGHMARARIIMTDMRHRVDIAPAINGGLHLHILAKPQSLSITA